MTQWRSISNPMVAPVILLSLLLFAYPGSAFCDLTLQGPSGFIQVPSHTTIRRGQFEMGFHTRLFKIPDTAKSRYLTHMAMGFSPIQDFEIGIQKAVDSRDGSQDPDPDPTINLKARLPVIGSGELAETAFGIVLDTNPNNYHTMYLTLGGFGVGWNFGGTPKTGVANYGSWDRGRQEPKSIFLLVGIDYPKPKPGERGYRSHYLFDYNGDVFSIGWRYKSHRGFWVDAAVHTKSTYTDFYDYRPLILGMGAIF